MWSLLTSMYTERCDSLCFSSQPVAPYGRLPCVWFCTLPCTRLCIQPAGMFFQERQLFHQYVSAFHRINAYHHVIVLTSICFNIMSNLYCRHSLYGSLQLTFSFVLHFVFITSLQTCRVAGTHVFTS